MKAAGFTNFREVTIRCYVNPWMSDSYEREVSRWFNRGLSSGILAMSIMPMIEGLKMSLAEVERLCQKVNEEICMLRHHAYFNM